MKIKASKKIIMAALALLMAVGLAAGSTFAWFSMNNKVTVTGMEVKTKVSSNLLIAEDTISSTTRIAEANFASSLEQTAKGILEPVSTIDGKAFYYTVDAKADGSKAQEVASDAYLAYSSSATASDATKFDSKFSEVYGVTTSDADALFTGKTGAVPYVDYVFQLKADNTSGAEQLIKLTQLDLTYGGTAALNNTQKAYRVAVFAQKFAADENPSAGEGTLRYIFAPASYSNWDSSAVKDETHTQSILSVYNTEPADGKYVAAITANSTEYVKVVVRLYLEGADTTCNNSTFMKLTNSWKLDLAFELDGTTDAVTSINMKAAS